MNEVILIGRLVKDPEFKFTPGTGIAVARFTLAVDRDYVRQDGQRDTDFINIVCWRKLAENVANNIGKGRLVAISGSIQTRKYQTNDGSNRYVTEVVADKVKFLDWPKESSSSFSKGNENVQSPQMEESPDFSLVDGEDDIPF